MIFNSYKMIFIHIPKTGGTSIENLLWPDISSRTEKDLWMGFVKPFYNKYQTGGLQHLLGKQIMKEIGEIKFNDYYKFSIVRNPWDKAVSQFSYIKKRNDLLSYLGMSNSDNFSQYLKKISTKEHVQWKKQVDFLLNEKGDLLVDDFFKMETMEKLCPVLSAKTGQHIESIPHLNKGIRGEYKDYYNKSTKKIIEEMVHVHA